MYYSEVKKYLINNQKVWLITGVAGFIGSNLAETLLKLNQKVISIDNFSTGYEYNIKSIRDSITKKQNENFTFIEGDIQDYKLCKDIVKDIDIVLHQAALGSVPRSINNPIDTNNSNVSGFLNILIAAKDSNVKRFVYASSSSVYGDSKELPKVEQNIGKPLSPYAVTKTINELYAYVFYKLYGIETIGLRYFNVFGKRQDPNGLYAAVIPKWIGQMMRGEEVYINGDGETSRDFTYIDNVVQMNILAGVTQNQNAFGEVFNTAVGYRETLNNLFKFIKQYLEQEIPNINIEEPIYRDFRKGDIRHSFANIEKAKNILSYRPTHTLQEGLKESINWYINNL